MCVCVCERERERERGREREREKEREYTFQLMNYYYFFPVVFVAHFNALMTGVGVFHIKHCGFHTQIQVQCVFHGGFEQNQN